MTGKDMLTKRPGEPENLRELLERRASDRPGKIFLFSEADGHRFTYAEFDAAVNRTAQLLVARGITKGDVAGLLMPILSRTIGRLQMPQVCADCRGYSERTNRQAAQA